MPEPKSDKKNFEGIDQINKQLRQEISIREQTEKRFRLVVEAVPNGIVMVNHKGKIVLVNKQIEKLFGYERNELLSQTIEFLIPPRYRNQHIKDRFNFSKDPQTRSMGAGRDLYALRKDGTEFPVEIGLSPLETEEGIFVLGSIIDISERKKSELEILEKTRELERSNKELDDFSYIASHDLKEPLRGIHNYAVFLAEDYADKLNQEGKDMLEKLGRLTKRMEDIINSLLEYSRVGRLNLQMKTVDVNQVIEETLESFHALIEEQNVKIKVSGTLPLVFSESVWVAEIFQNLISNAIRYNDKPEKQIEIGHLDTVPASEPVSDSPLNPSFVVFYVRDNGIGIPEKHLDNIFKIFKRLHGRDQYGGGSGVGLTIIKKMVERQGGKIWVESKMEEGSTFYFALKRA